MKTTPIEEDPVVRVARNIVTREIALQTEMAIRTNRYVLSHESGCKCHRCRMQYEDIKVEVDNTANDWVSMLAGSPTCRDKVHPEWNRNAPTMTRTRSGKHEPPKLLFPPEVP